MEYSFKCFGEGLEIKILEIPSEVYNQVDNFIDANDSSLIEMLFDHSLSNINEATVLKNQKLVSKAHLFNLDQKGKVEIKMKNRKILSVPSSQLLAEETLFPLFNIRSVYFNFKRKKRYRYIAYGYNITGLVLSSVISTQKEFDVNSIEFHIINFQTQGSKYKLAQLAYENQIIKSLNNDYVIRGMFANWV